MHQLQYSGKDIQCYSPLLGYSAVGITSIMMKQIDADYNEELSHTCSKYEACNVRGTVTLAIRETKRFMSVFSQTILAPVIMICMFSIVFRLLPIENVSEESSVVFIFPGLVMMSIIQNTFANPSSSLMIARIQGCLPDTLMPPLSPAEIMIGYIAGGVLRGMMIAVISLAIFVIWHDVAIASPLQALYFSMVSAITFSVIGMIAGMWAKKFDHIATFTNFFITPLSFLSGTFYSPDQLPEIWQKMMIINPVYYLISGFRDSITDQAYYTLWLGGIISLVVMIISIWICYVLVRRGYGLRIT